MAYILLHHKVADYHKWKAAFDATESTRRECGSKGGYVLRNIDDPNDIWVLLHWEDEASLRTFFQTIEMQKSLRDAGVQGDLEVHYLEAAAKPSV